MSENKELMWAGIGLVPPIIAGIVWIATISSTATESVARTDRIVAKIQRMEAQSEERYDKAMAMLQDIRERTIRIEQKQADGK